MHNIIEKELSNLYNDFMRISHDSYQKYLETNTLDFSNKKVFSPLLINNKTLFFPYMEEKGKALIIDLNPSLPLVFIASKEAFFSSFENSFLQRFRKVIGKSEIKNIKLSDNDLVVEIDLFSLDNLESFKLICELFPNHPNLFVLNSRNELLEFYFKSATRQFEIGKEFILNQNGEFLDGEIIVSEQLIEEKFKKILDIRESEKYADLLKIINSKIKAADKRLKAIADDVKNARKNLIFKEIADTILSSGLPLKSHQNSFIFNEEKINLDDSKTLLENAENFYKKSKKAKETISRSETNIQNALDEKTQYQNLLEEFNSANEKKKEELVELYTFSKKKKQFKPTALNRPWKININGTIIYFGRNASQNDYLSFAMKLDREFTWMHIKDKSGAHLVIANKKPTEEELLVASEIALLCSKASCGEISYTKKKNVRRGHVLGEAIIKNYSTIKVNSIRKENRDLLEKAKRCD